MAALVLAPLPKWYGELIRCPQEQLIETSELISPSTRLIHIFDREGDIAEVFDAAFAI